MWTTLNFNSKSKMKRKLEWRYLQGCPRYRIGWDLPVGLGVPLGDRHTEKYFFFQFQGFFGKSRKCHKFGFRMYYYSAKFNQNRWSYFWENQIFYFFFLCELPLILGLGWKLNKKVRDICERRRKNLKIYFSCFRDFFGKSR